MPTDLIGVDAVIGFLITAAEHIASVATLSASQSIVRLGKGCFSASLVPVINGFDGILGTAPVYFASIPPPGTSTTEPIEIGGKISSTFSTTWTPPAASSTSLIHS